MVHERTNGRNGEAPGVRCSDHVLCARIWPFRLIPAG
jgi:hypothetical protein